MLVANLILYPGRSSLILTSRYIVVDGVSWNIICKDLELLLTDSNPSLPSRGFFALSSGSFARWAQSQMSHLPKTIGSELLRAETAFWNLHKHSTRDHGIVERQISMDSDVTERVFGICVGPFNTKPVEPVITAELLSFRNTFSTRGSPVLYNQHDGRVERDISLDTWGRTSGCFATLVPIVGEIESDTSVEQAVAKVKEAYRAVLRDGSSAFASCMFGRNPLSPSDVELLINFKDVETTITGASIEEPQLLGLLRISAEFHERQLHFRIKFSSGIACQDRLVSWISERETTLEEFESQLPYQEPKLTQSEMPLLAGKEEELESIQRYLQSMDGILFAQLKGQQHQYWECLTLKITPEGAMEYVDVDSVAAAWKALCVAQPMLRSIFTSSPSSVGAFQQEILQKMEPSILHSTVELQTGLESILKTMEEPHFAALISQQLRQAYANLASILRGRAFGRYIS